MDSKKDEYKLPPDSPIHGMISAVMQIENIIKQVENGDNLGLNAEQKIEYKKQMQEKGGNQAITDIQNKIVEFRKKAMNTAQENDKH